MISYGEPKVDIVLQPVSGKALPVYQGEVLRITQLGDGQCVDFNCFNVHDYKEHMSVGHMRRQGFRIRKGDLIWSNPPRFNPMMAIMEMPQTCSTDLLASRCHAGLFEVIFGLENHPNCQDTFAEAIGEYGLTPDDVHDSFNMWMNSGWDDAGGYQIRKNTGLKGDYVDLLALMDVLAVPIVCGSGDIITVSNFCLKSIQVQVFHRSDETEVIVQDYLRRYTGLKNQRTVDTFRIKDIRTERELSPIQGYEPHFVNYPITLEEIEIELSEEDYEQLQILKEQGLGRSDEEAIRTAVMSRYYKNRAMKPWLGRKA